MKLTVIFLSFFMIPQFIHADEFLVKEADNLVKLAPDLKPGDKVILISKSYTGEVTLANIKGTENRPIVITGKGIENTIFENGRQAIHLINCHNLILRDFSVKNFSINGINADDGGSQTNPSTGLVFDRIKISGIGPQGNYDGFKLSGIHEFKVSNCLVSGWGGSAIDMVGCHSGEITNCKFIGQKGFSQNSGVQIKGGSSKITVKGNLFDNAGERAVNLGGSTGDKWFRPVNAKYEAKQIEIADNTFHGSLAPVAFVTSMNNHVHNNTFVNPEKWVFRILQETKNPDFVKCRSSTIEKNIIIYNGKVRVFVNVGGGTEPETFKFNDNIWIDTAGKRIPELPVTEINGLYNVDLQQKLKADRTVSVQNKKFINYGVQGNSN